MQNEFINVLTNHVNEILAMNIKSTRYFGLMFDNILDKMGEVI